MFDFGFVNLQKNEGCFLGKKPLAVVWDIIISYSKWSESSSGALAAEVAFAFWSTPLWFAHCIIGRMRHNRVESRHTPRSRYSSPEPSAGKSAPKMGQWVHRERRISRLLALKVSFLSSSIRFLTLMYPSQCSFNTTLVNTRVLMSTPLLLYLNFVHVFSLLPPSRLLWPWR